VLPFGQAKKARFAITSGGGALGDGSAIFLQLEQNGLLDFCHSSKLLAAALEKIAPDKALAVGSR
jgi:hypothetical protein